MDPQFDLSVAGIFATSATLISSAPNRRLFFHLTASLLLPFSLLFLLHTLISHLLIGNAFLLSKLLSFLLLLPLSLLPLSAVVYSSASLLTATSPKDPAFSPNLIFSLLPKIRTRLLLTHLTALFLLAAQSLFSFLLFFAVNHYFGRHLSLTSFVLYYAVFYSYAKRIVRIGRICLMGIVVSVLEDLSHVLAMEKSDKLIKVKSTTANSVFLAMVSGFWVADFGFGHFVLADDLGLGLGLVWRVGLGIAIVGLMTVASLFLLVVQTVLYLVCKNGHEGVDKASLGDRLEVMGIGNYLPVKQEDVVVEQEPSA